MAFLSDLPPIEKIQKDLKMHAIVLREVLTSLSNKQKTAEFTQIALENIQRLLTLLNVAIFAPLLPLLQALYRYFYTLQRGMLFEAIHLETLALIIGELIQVSDLKVNDIEQFLAKLQTTFAQSENRLDQWIKNFKPSSFHNKTKEIPLDNPPPIESELVIDESMLTLLCIEIETQCLILNHDLLEMERDPTNYSFLESLMRAAHSIKGAARVVSLNPIVHLAHAMEDTFVAIQHQQIDLNAIVTDRLFQGIDLLSRLSKVKFKIFNEWLQENSGQIQQLTNQMSLKNSSPSLSIQTGILVTGEIKKNSSLIAGEGIKKIESTKTFQTTFTHDRILRVTAQNLNRLMGLAGESLVESRWLYPFNHLLQQLKKQHNELESDVDLLRDQLNQQQINEKAQRTLINLQHKINELRYATNERLRELDSFIRRHASLSDRLYQEVINSRMRPFSDGVEGLSRLARDLSHHLNKQVKLIIEGKATPIDRDILEKLETPLNHLIRNAIDHGIESPQKRLEAGKPAEGTILLEARHLGGMLAITVADDGKGINISQLRQRIIDKNLVSAEIANRLTDAEVIDFLFLPGFSTAEELTEVSGRGMGLNIVQNFIQEVGGTVRTISTPGKGLSFNLQLPLTLSVIRALLLEIAGEPYAFPLARIDQAFLIPLYQIETIENRQFFHYEGKNIGLISAADVLELEAVSAHLKNIPVIVLSDQLNCYGLVVDRIIGEKELVVQELDSRLGKVLDIAAGALMEDGNPVLIIDVEDIMRSIDNLLSGGRLIKVAYSQEDKHVKISKRILVVDDSITVREVECRLLQNYGYTVETAVNGMDGWNAIRIGQYDLVITDVDMPRMNGIDLVRAIKADMRLRHLPVMIVSYKEGEEDRIKGLEAGADYYLTKSSFHDATLLEAVNDLIGQP
jgi:two-component system, chemotaxis family, sensor histidine kinase and response regulator WspE